LADAKLGPNYVTDDNFLTFIYAHMIPSVEPVLFVVRNNVDVDRCL